MKFVKVTLNETGNYVFQFCQEQLTENPPIKVVEVCQISEFTPEFMLSVMDAVIGFLGGSEAY